MNPQQLGRAWYTGDAQHWPTEWLNEGPPAQCTQDPKTQRRMGPQGPSTPLPSIGWFPGGLPSIDPLLIRSHRPPYNGQRGLAQSSVTTACLIRSQEKPASPADRTSDTNGYPDMVPATLGVFLSLFPPPLSLSPLLPSLPRFHWLPNYSLLSETETIKVVLRALVTNGISGPLQMEHGL